MIDLEFNYTGTNTQRGVLGILTAESDEVDCDQIHSILGPWVQHLVSVPSKPNFVQVIIDGDDSQQTIDAAHLLRLNPKWTDCVTVVSLPFVSMAAPRWNVDALRSSVPEHRPWILSVRLVNKTTILEVPLPKFGDAFLIPEYNMGLNMCVDRDVRLRIEPGRAVRAEIVWFDEGRRDVLSRAVACGREVFDMTHVVEGR